MRKAGLPQDSVDDWIEKILECTNYNRNLTRKKLDTDICDAMLSMQTLLNYCYYYCSGWTTRLHHIDANLHFPTLFFIFTLLLYIFISCFFYIPLFYFTYYTPFYCGVTDGGWSTWPNLVFYLARVFSYFADFYCTSPSFIASSKKRPYTILGEFLAFILIVYSLVLFSLSLFPLYLLPISLLHARFYSLLGAVHLFVA